MEHGPRHLKRSIGGSHTVHLYELEYIQCQCLLAPPYIQPKTEKSIYCPLPKNLFAGCPHSHPECQSEYKLIYFWAAAKIAASLLPLAWPSPEPWADKVTRVNFPPNIMTLFF